MAKPKRNTSYYLTMARVDAARNFVSGETLTTQAYFKDAAGAWTSFTPANAWAEIGTTGIHGLTLTAAEMNHDSVLVKIRSANATDNFVRIDLDNYVVDDIWSNVYNTYIAVSSSGVSLSSVTMADIADTTLKRNLVNVEASSVGDALSFQSLYGLSAGYTCKRGVSGSNWVTYRTNGSTVLGSQPVTTSVTAAPITGVG